MINIVMNYLIYKITNNVNNKIYIGCHKTQDVNDGYMGSGKMLKYAIEKYGIEHFTKEILQNFNNPTDMFAMESELVNEAFVKDNNTYNMKEGGHGGFDHINNSEKHKIDVHLGQKATHKILTEKHGKNYRKDYLAPLAHKGRENKYKPLYGDNWQATIMEKARKVQKVLYPNGTFYGNKHTDEAKAKIGEANSKKQKGSGNSQFGTMWITNEEVNKKIKKDQPMPEGFRKGRISPKQ